jgi:hypothetical protein
MNDFEAQQYCKLSPLLCFHGNTNEYFYIIGGYM